MAYIGSKPADKPVVASDLDPTIITGQTALATAPADTDEFLISDAGVLKRLDASLIGGDGITEADQWRLTTSFTGDATPIASNLARVNTDGGGKIGTGLSQSSGIFTFPSTGTWLIIFQCASQSESGQADSYHINYIETTTDNSTYSQAASGWGSGAATYRSGASAFFTFNVSSTTTHKVRFSKSNGNAATYTLGTAGLNYTSMTFIRLGDST